MNSCVEVPGSQWAYGDGTFKQVITKLSDILSHYSVMTSMGKIP